MLLPALRPQKRTRPAASSPRAPCPAPPLPSPPGARPPPTPHPDVGLQVVLPRRQVAGLGLGLSAPPRRRAVQRPGPTLHLQQLLLPLLLPLAAAVIPILALAAKLALLICTASGAGRAKARVGGPCSEHTIRWEGQAAGPGRPGRQRRRRNPVGVGSTAVNRGAARPSGTDHMFEVLKQRISRLRVSGRSLLLAACARPGHLPEDPPISSSLLPPKPPPSSPASSPSLHSSSCFCCFLPLAGPAAAALARLPFAAAGGASSSSLSPSCSPPSRPSSLPLSSPSSSSSLDPKSSSIMPSSSARTCATPGRLAVMQHRLERRSMARRLQTEIPPDWALKAQQQAAYQWQCAAGRQCSTTGQRATPANCSTPPRAHARTVGEVFPRQLIARNILVRSELLLLLLLFAAELFHLLLLLLGLEPLGIVVAEPGRLSPGPQLLLLVGGCGGRSLQ